VWLYALYIPSWRTRAILTGDIQILRTRRGLTHNRTGKAQAVAMKETRTDTMGVTRSILTAP
jgi:hypothetical protein